MKMTELKTLKDIKNTGEAINRICSCGSTKESHGLEWIRESAIRQEAIQHAKELKNDKSPYYDKFKEPWKSDKKPVIEWIEHFFNIDEEELK